jgi:hypothetical protein
MKNFKFSLIIILTLLNAFSSINYKQMLVCINIVNNYSHSLSVRSFENNIRYYVNQEFVENFDFELASKERADICAISVEVKFIADNELVWGSIFDVQHKLLKKLTLINYRGRGQVKISTTDSVTLVYSDSIFLY